MNELRDILESHEVQPSAECWQKISQHLDQVMPSSTEGGSGQELSGQEVEKQISRLAGAAKAKLIVAITGIVLGGGAITMLSLSKHHNSSEPVSPTTIISSDSIYLDNQPLPNLSKTSDVTVSPSKNQTEYVTEINNPESVTEEVFFQPVSEAPQPIPTTTATPAPIPTAPTLPQVIQVPTTLPTNTHHVTSPEEDPVALEHMEEIESPETPQKLEIPNVFTPNGDGINDMFVILGLEQCSERSLVVFNSSGKVVYQSKRYDNNWDGGGCPDGTYFYQFSFDRHQIIETVKGSVTIIRK